MRRLITGHAVRFNRRHARKGHLFQNRYKSIVVEEEPYFSGLVRSAGGVEAVLSRRIEEREAADPRILGAGAFVEEVWAKSETPKRRTIADMDGILSEVSESTNVSREDFGSQPSTQDGGSVAAVLFYARAQEEAGATAALLGRLTGRSHVAVTKAVNQARRFGERKTEQA